jgi:hypothetical protein
MRHDDLGTSESGMKRLFANLVRRFNGGDAALAVRPILAGYRREMAPGWRVLILAALALIALIYGLAFGYMAPARMMPLVAPIALLCGLVIWALPPGDYAPTPLIEPLFVAFFAALILWPNYLAIALPSLPWLTLLRIIGVPLIVVLLICISVSSVFRSRLWKVIITDKAIVLLMVGIIVTQVITLPLSNDIGMSFNRFIVAQVNWTAIFFLSCIVFIRPGFAEFWVRILLAMLLVLCFFGFWEARLSQVPWAGQIPTFLKVDDDNVKRILRGAARTASGIYRVQGTATTSLGFAEILGLAIPFALHLALNRYRVIDRLYGIAFIPIAIWVIVLTDSRLGVVAAGASVMFYLLIWALIRWRQNRASIFGPAIVIAYPALFCAVLASTFLVGRIRHQVWGDGSQQASTDSRIDQWITAIPKIAKNPIGHGMGQGADALGWANQAGVITIDSYYLSILLEIGVIGFIFYYGLIIRGIWRATKTVIYTRGDSEIRLLIPMSVSLINFFIVKSVLSQDANHPLMFMIIGAVVALAYRDRTTMRESS